MVTAFEERYHIRCSGNSCSSVCQLYISVIDAVEVMFVYNPDLRSNARLPQNHIFTPVFIQHKCKYSPVLYSTTFLFTVYPFFLIPVGSLLLYTSSEPLPISDEGNRMREGWRG